MVPPIGGGGGPGEGGLAGIGHPPIGGAISPSRAESLFLLN